MGFFPYFMMRLSHLFKYRYIQVLTHHQFIQQKSSYYTYFYVCNRKINDNWHWYCGDPKKKEWCQSILAIAAATGINGGVISQKMRIAYSSSSNVGGRRRSTNGRRTNRHRIRTDGTAAAAATCVYVPTTTYFWRSVLAIRTDMRRDAYKFVHPHLMRSYVGPLWMILKVSQSTFETSTHEFTRSSCM